MLGHKARDFRQHESISLEDLVPADNFYRQVERSIDLGFVRELAAEFYAGMGRPSIDPVVFFKLKLIAFFEGIRSERQLVELGIQAGLVWGDTQRFANHVGRR